MLPVDLMIDFESLGYPPDGGGDQYGGNRI